MINRPLSTFLFRYRSRVVCRIKKEICIIKELIYSILGNKSFFRLLLIINLLGTLYGYYWYKWQLVQTPLHFLPFVPDSPTASLFFVFVLIAFLKGEKLAFNGSLGSNYTIEVWCLGGWDESCRRIS